MTYTPLQQARNAGSAIIGQPGHAGEVVVDTDDFSLIVMDGATNGGFQVPAKINADIQPPQGRLTCSSNTPVMTADVGPATTIYYTPYVGAYIPIFDGNYWRSVGFGQFSIGLAAGVQLNGKLYDLFAFLASGTLTLGTGPAWTNNTTRSAALAVTNGIWTNNASITLNYGAASASTATPGAHQATYLGTLYATANGQTAMQFRKAAASGGSAPVLGVWNAYNRVRYVTRSLDNTLSWTSSTAAYRQANNSGSNQASWVDGLAQSFVEATYSCDGSVSAGTTAISLGLNGTTPEAHTPATASTSNVNMTARSLLNPQIGFNTIEALEWIDSALHTATFVGNGQQQLTLSLDM